MKTLEEFNSDIAEYLLTLKSRNGIDIAPQSTRDKWQKVLNDIVLVVISKGHDTPSEKDYEEYRASKNISDETFKRYKKQIDMFFSWRKERRQEPMTYEGILETVEPETVHDAEPSQVAGVVEAENVNHGGRKRFDTVKGEKRTEKLMLYLTPSVIADIRDWCKIKDISAVNYITGLVVADMASRQDKLNSFRQLRDEA